MRNKLKHGIHGVPGLSAEIRSAFQRECAAITSEASASLSQPQKRRQVKPGRQQAQGAGPEPNSISDSHFEDFESFDGFDDNATADQDNQDGHEADDEDAAAADELSGSYSVH
ncbi:hypothetical protein HDU80_006539, partial [Chytriomyces hyalinus]